MAKIPSSSSWTARAGLPSSYTAYIGALGGTKKLPWHYVPVTLFHSSQLGQPPLRLRAEATAAMAH